MFRAFVYDNHINPANWIADRANAAVDLFKDLDGWFDDNVIVQIKYGPIDLQVQEYLGQQSHLVYLALLWKEILDFDLRADDRPSKVKDIISGKRFNRPLGGFAAVVNVGTNSTWLGSHLAMSNLYAYGMMAWDPSVEPEPNPASQDNNGWGQWTRADSTSIGMDRTVKNGTGNVGQYRPTIAKRFEDMETTPDNLLLWFHHVPYAHVPSSGKTVIQHFYDADYEGAATAQTFVEVWQSLKGKIDNDRYEDVNFRQIYQAGHALVWRDAINEFYHNLTGIPDLARRVGNHPYRILCSKSL
ncbi:glycoside hydrolase family 67 protein [Pleomassaria siparia CBS 279.74]|uniref:Glycoside hydrolase family 67 protein n=1 Tax=Pleomassaria siparia CBS 279.74 TaxID=1314801 RepID=A0A6G1K8P6_9PLEO|nr:glycoside hydrolase family 67 protein [Pleomassaria siparia CBS 279.74]